MHLTIRNHDGRLLKSLFGTSKVNEGSTVSSGEGVVVQFSGEEIIRGAIETTFVVHLLVDIPIGIVANVAARFLYDKIKEYLSSGDVLEAQGKAIEVEGMAELQSTLTQLLEHARGRQGS